MVVGLVSGAGAKGCLIAIATAGEVVMAGKAEPADKRAAPGDVAEGLGMLPTTAGAAVCESEVDPVLRAPSILPPDLASEVREGDSF
jgi:hypothetical protein